MLGQFLSHPPVELGPIGPELVLAGKATSAARPWLDRIARPPLAGRVRHVGYVDPADRQALYGGARMLVLPSFDEGFGLPAVEAAACGAAVVATRHSAIPEVLGDAALYIDPADAASLPAALSLLLSDPERRAGLGRRAAARARDWTWEAAARRLLAVFEEFAP